MPNPYQPNEFNAPNGELPQNNTSPFPRLLEFLLAWGAWIYALIVLACYNGVWLLAYFELGHAPRPMLDDPKFVKTVGAGGAEFGLVIVGTSPVAALGGIFSQFFVLRREFGNRLLFRGFDPLTLDWAPFSVANRRSRHYRMAYGLGHHMDCSVVRHASNCRG